MDNVADEAETMKTGKILCITVIALCFFVMGVLADEPHYINYHGP